MTRILAAWLATATLSVLGPTPMLHVHAYGDHDHPDHTHGPAPHAHGPSAHSRHRDERPGDAAVHHLQSCDPGAHAVAVRLTCVSPTAPHAALADAGAAAGVTPPAPARGRATLRDVRAHSPPRLTDAPLRAPPVVHPA